MNFLDAAAKLRKKNEEILYNKNKRKKRDQERNIVESKK